MTSPHGRERGGDTPHLTWVDVLSENPPPPTAPLQTAITHLRKCPFLWDPYFHHLCAHLFLFYIAREKESKGSCHFISNLLCSNMLGLLYPTRHCRVLGCAALLGLSRRPGLIPLLAAILVIPQFWPVNLKFLVRHFSHLF